MPYGKKREHYLSQNLLVRAYEHNLGFLRFIEESGLPFRPHPEFKMADLDARQRLYQMLAEQIRNPERLIEAAS